jgi:hypothetical protein
MSKLRKVLKRVDTFTSDYVRSELLPHTPSVSRLNEIVAEFESLRASLKGFASRASAKNEDEIVYGRYLVRFDIQNTSSSYI